MTEIERQALRIVRQMLIGGLAQSEHDEVRELAGERIAAIEQQLLWASECDEFGCHGQETDQP